MDIAQPLSVKMSKGANIPVPYSQILRFGGQACRRKPTFDYYFFLGGGRDMQMSFTLAFDIHRAASSVLCQGLCVCVCV